MNRFYYNFFLVIILCSVLISCSTREKLKSSGPVPAPAILGERVKGNCQRELNGFFLDQHPNSAKNRFGAPVQSGEYKNTLWEKYIVNDDTYMVFEVLKSEKEAFSSILLMGQQSELIYPFLGIRLGDDLNKINSWFDTPDVTIETDEGLTELKYKERNFSFLVNHAEKIAGIKIWATENKYDNPGSDDYRFHWNSFKGGIYWRNIETIMFRIRPDAKILIGDQEYMFDSPLRELFENDNNFFNKLFLSIDGCLFQEVLKIESKQANKIKKRIPNGYVYLFPNSQCLEKITFTKYYGRWRVSEIKMLSALPPRR